MRALNLLATAATFALIFGAMVLCGAAFTATVRNAIALTSVFADRI